MTVFGRHWRTIRPLRSRGNFDSDLGSAVDRGVALTVRHQRSGCVVEQQLLPARGPWDATLNNSRLCYIPVVVWSFENA